MHLVALGKPAAVVPVEYQKTKITLYKVEDALAARCKVASKLTHRMLTALQRKRNVNDEPEWAPMQQLFDAGLSYDPFSGMPVFDPRTCAPALLKALWRGFCGVADTINTKQMGQTDKALDELQMRLHEHAAQITERKQGRRAGALAKRPRASSPAPSLSDEGTDTGEATRVAKLRPRRVIPDDDNDDDGPTPMPPVAGSDDADDEGNDDGDLHQPGLDDYIGSCSYCGGPEPHCIACGVCYCAWCEPGGCRDDDAALHTPPDVADSSSEPESEPAEAKASELKPTCKPVAPSPPSPPPSPPGDKQRVASLRGRSPTGALDQWLDGVRVRAADKSSRRGGKPPASCAATAAPLHEQGDMDVDDAPESPNAARRGGASHGEIVGVEPSERPPLPGSAAGPWARAAAEVERAAEELAWRPRRVCNEAETPNETPSEPQKNSMNGASTAVGPCMSAPRVSALREPARHGLKPYNRIESTPCLQTAKRFTMRLKACRQDYKRALALLDEMRGSRVLPNVFHYSAAISACEKGGQWQRALALLGEMRAARVVPDVITFNAAISACEKGGQWQRALALLDEMRAARVAPNVITFSAAISACEKGGQWQWALALLDEMRAARVAPNVTTFSAAISACARANQPERAMRLWDELCASSSLVIDGASFNAILDAVVCWPRKARELWEFGLERGVYPSNHPYLQREDGCSICVLDLHGLGEGAAEAAIHWLLDEKVSVGNRGFIYDSTHVDDVRFITGWGRSRKLTHTGDLRARAIATLGHRGLPIVPTRNPGVVQTKGGTYFEAAPFQIMYRDLHGHHGSLDGVCCDDTASAVLHRIAAKLGLSEAATSRVRLVKAGKQLEPTVACGLAKGDTVHVLGRVEGGIRHREVGSASGAALIDAPGEDEAAFDERHDSPPSAEPPPGMPRPKERVSAIEMHWSDISCFVCDDRHAAQRCEVALSAMCRGMTELTHGRLCIVGSYALHRHICAHLRQAPSWTPNDIDIFYCPNGGGRGAVGDGLDRDDLRRRLVSMARCCQMEMCGAGEVGGFHYHTTTSYSANVKRDRDDDGEDAACVAAFAREQLVSLCSSERPRAREYRICWTTKVFDSDARGGWPPVFNLVEVEPAGQFAQFATVGTGDRFAIGVLAGFDLVPCQVAYISGKDARLTEVANDATRAAIRGGELRLAGGAFERTDVYATLCQLDRMRKYVARGFRLPPGSVAAAPMALREGTPSSALNHALLELLGGRLHWEPSTPPRAATPARRPQCPLLLKFSRTDGSDWRVAVPRSSAVAPPLATAPMDGAAVAAPARRLCSQPEALAVWTFVNSVKNDVYRTKRDLRACVRQYSGWRVLGQLRRSGKGIDRFDLYVLPPDVLPDLPLRSLRPTNRAVRSFRGLWSLLVQRCGATAAGGGGAATAARLNGRCPSCCALPCCQRASAGGAQHAASAARAAPPLPPKKRYRAVAGPRVHDPQAVASGNTCAANVSEMAGVEYAAAAAAASVPLLTAAEDGGKAAVAARLDGDPQPRPAANCESAAERPLGWRPIRVCGEDEEPVDMWAVAGEDQPW